MTEFYGLSAADQVGRLTTLAHEALSHWGIIDAEVGLIKHRENAVYSVRQPDGVRYALRVHRGGYHSNDELRSELQWMQALDDYGVHTPPIIPAKDGELFKVVASDGVPEARQCDLLGWVDGKPLGSIEGGVETDRDTLVQSYHTVGELAAKLHNQATSWALPNDFARHAWDVDGILGENPFWGRFWELKALTASQLNLLQRAREKLRAQLVAFGQNNDRYSLIHADFLPENLLVTAEDIKLIDFDDSGFGWHLFELATSLFFHLGEDHFDDVCQSIVTGYRLHRELSDEHLEQLPGFFLARGYTYLGWAHTRKETETAQAMTPMIVEGVCALADDYLSG
jgi:Ser/Thr protein kinase RdoA (MazF antagonist)